MNRSLATARVPSSLRRARFAALVAAALAAAPAAVAQSTLFSVDGEQAGAHFGDGGIAPVGDVNGDGAADFVASDPFYDGKVGTDCGRVQLFGGSKGAPKLLATWEGALAGDRFGSFVRNVHDVDGDGVDEFAVAAVGYPDGTEQGKVEVYSGRKWHVLLTFQGENAGDQFGRVCGVGDATNDGIPDVLVSAIGWNKAANGIGGGRVYLYSGKDGRLHKTWDGMPGQELGFRIAAMNADLLGDDGLEIAIGSRQRGLSPPLGGMVEIHSGQFGWNNYYQFASYIPGDDQAYVCDALDGDGDGWPEFLMAAPGKNGGNGWIRLRSTSDPFAQRLEWNGTAELPYDGETAMAGDTDRDGFGDFLFSSRLCDGAAGPDVGVVAVVSGWHGRELTRKQGPDPGSAMGGGAMAFAGDLNGDGFPDFMAAAPWADLPALDKAGQLRAFSGDDLYLTVSHETAYDGDYVKVSTTGGAPNKTMICACTEIDGVACFLPIFASMAFDANGEFFFNTLVDATLTGHDLRFQSFGLPATGRRLEISGSVALALR